MHTNLYIKLSSQERKLYDAIYQGLINLLPEISIPKMNSEKINEICNLVLCEHPELAVVNNAEYDVYRSAFEVMLIPSYLFGQDELVQRRFQYLQECENIVNNIVTRDMDEFQRELSIYNYVCRNVRYGLLGTDDTSVLLSQSQFSALFDKKAVCKGIAMLFKCLCDLAELECYLVEGTVCRQGLVDSHAWNIVKIQNKFYFVDTVCDTISYEQSGTMTYAFFNFAEDVARKNYTWKRNNYPVCDSLDSNYFVKLHAYVHNDRELGDLMKRCKDRKYIYVKFSDDYYLGNKNDEEIGDILLDYICKEKPGVHICAEYKWNEESKSMAMVVR